jgi:hypothetical protein
MIVFNAASPHPTSAALVMVREEAWSWSLARAKGAALLADHAALGEVSRFFSSGVGRFSVTGL